MGKSENGGQDPHEKSLEAYNDVFADVVNAFLFEGAATVPEDELEDVKTSSTYWGNDRPRTQDRDVAKRWKKGKTCVAYFGCENQTKPDPDMPLRGIGYDGAAYRGQLFYVKGKNGRRKLNRNPRYPVVTLVLYFGYKARWKGARRLKEVLTNVPEGLERFVNDYEVHVIEVAWLTDEELGRLKSDFGIVADFFTQKRKNGDYVPSNKEIIHVSETLELLSAITGDERFKETCFEKGKEAPKTMCEVLNRVEKRGERRGRIEGSNSKLVENLEALMRNMHWTIQEACRALGITEQEYQTAKKQTQ